MLVSMSGSNSVKNSNSSLQTVWRYWSVCLEKQNNGACIVIKASIQGTRLLNGIVEGVQDGVN